MISAKTLVETHSYAFEITDDGLVHRVRGGRAGELLGHVACILNDSRSTPASQTALDVQWWWNQLMYSEDRSLIAFPHLQDDDTAKHHSHNNVAISAPDVLEETARAGV